MSVNVFLIAENVYVSIGLLSLINQCLPQLHFFCLSVWKTYVVTGKCPLRFVFIIHSINQAEIKAVL